MSTPAGKFSFFNSSTVLAVGSMMSSNRLWVRISNWSIDFLSTCGERFTVNFSIRVGSGIGPATRAPVRLAVSTMSTADWSSMRWSNAFRRMRIRCASAMLLGLLLVKNRAYEIGGHGLKMGRFHRVTGAPLGKRANRGRVTEHFRERHFGIHDRQVSARFDAVDLG